ncbi:MAG: protease inhibitor I42 family protein [Methanoregula sp.]|nr:protease inhibitor I42 family protein [Methanoregula sp.]
MKHTALILSLGIIFLLAITVAFAGYTDTGKQTPTTPERTPFGTRTVVGHLEATEEQNNATIAVMKGTTIIVRLPENPTTGYQWNLTTTPGLNITSDTYVPSDTTAKLMGAGGTRIWDISATGTGEQKINAVYKRSWMQTTGNETRFSMTVIVS